MSKRKKIITELFVWLMVAIGMALVSAAAFMHETQVGLITSGICLGIFAISVALRNFG